jgi:hypothetical protein
MVDKTKTIGDRLMKVSYRKNRDGIRELSNIPL